MEVLPESFEEIAAISGGDATVVGRMLNRLASDAQERKTDYGTMIGQLVIGLAELEGRVVALEHRLQDDPSNNAGDER